MMIVLSVVLCFNILIFQEVISANMSTNEAGSVYHNLFSTSEFNGSYGHLTQQFLEIMVDFQNGIVLGLNAVLNILKGPIIEQIFNLIFEIFKSSLHLCRRTAHAIYTTCESVKESSNTYRKAKSAGILLAGTTLLLSFRSIYSMFISMRYHITSLLMAVFEIINVFLKNNLEDRLNIHEFKIREQKKTSNLSLKLVKI